LHESYGNDKLNRQAVWRRFWLNPRKGEAYDFIRSYVFASYATAGSFSMVVIPKRKIAARGWENGHFSFD